MFLQLLLAAGVATAVPGGEPATAELTSYELTALSKERSEGRAVLAVKNVGAAPIASVVAACRVRVNGQEVGAGTGKRGKIKPGKRVALEIDFKVDHDRFKAAAGGVWVEGVSVDSELEGSMTLRFPTGDVAVPFKFSKKMGTDGARSGVFAHPLSR